MGRMPGGARQVSRWLAFFVALVTSTSGCQWAVRASAPPSGSQAPAAPSGAPALSADGRDVAFWSDRSDLVAGDTNGQTDVFVRDLRTDHVERVSVTSLGGQSAGRSHGDLDISADGQVVAFWSLASDLAPGDPPGWGVFVRDRTAGTTVAVPGVSSPGGSGSVELSADGRRVAMTWGNGLVVYDRLLGTQSTMFPGSPLPAWDMSADAQSFATSSLVAIPSPENPVFVTVQVSVHHFGSDAETIDLADSPALSADGRSVVVRRWRRVTPTVIEPVGMVEVDLDTDVATPVAPSLPGSRDARPFALSEDGETIAYTSTFPAVAEDTNARADVYVLDRASGAFALASTGPGGRAGLEGTTDASTLSADGRYVGFESLSSDLVPGDEPDTLDVFVRAVPKPRPTAVTPSTVLRGTTTTVQVQGTWLRPATEVGVDGTGVAVEEVTWSSEHGLTVVLEVAASAPPGPRTVTVTAAGTGPGPGAGATGICAGCLTIT